MQEAQPPTSRFKAEMPRIPGVSDSSATSANSLGKRVFLSIGLVAILAILGGIVRWSVHSMGRRAERRADAAEALPAESPDSPLLPASTAWTPVAAATVDELAKPWSAKEFTFVDPVTHSSTPAMVVHLPGGAASSSASYWAFSLEAPYERCQLEYIADLDQLAARFNYRGTHPVVASACDGTIYDPLKMDTIPTGAWVRGEIVQGAGIRPPTSIEVKIQGNSLVADRIE